MRINIWGGIPEPIGGVTNHIYRLSQKLHQQNYNVCVIDAHRNENKYHHQFDVYYLNKDFFKILVDIRECINHVHVADLINFKKVLLFFFVSIVVLRKRFSILTIHAGTIGEILENLSLFRRMIIKKFLNRFGHIIAINEEISECLKKFGYRGNVVQANSYIGSPIKIKRSDFDKNNIKIITSGYLQPLYNYEGLIKVCEELIGEGYHLSLTVVIYGATDFDYQEKISSYLKKHFVSVGSSENDKFMELLAQHDIYVRNTDADSYGLAVAEAISVGTPVLATNVCKRAEGTILYNCRDYAELKKKMIWLISNYKTSVAEIRNVKINDGYGNIRKLYDSIQ